MRLIKCQKHYLLIEVNLFLFKFSFSSNFLSLCNTIWLIKTRIQRKFIFLFRYFIIFKAFCVLQNVYIVFLSCFFLFFFCANLLTFLIEYQIYHFCLSREFLCSLLLLFFFFVYQLTKECIFEEILFQIDCYMFLLVLSSKLRKQKEKFIIFISPILRKILRRFVFAFEEFLKRV